MNENTNTGNMALTSPAASVVAAPRTLDMVAAEIRTFTASMLNNIIEIGRRMCEAKEMLPYGKFGEWIKENTGYSRSTANNFMRVYQEYGTRQGSLFGATVENDQAFGKLNYTQALALLALPAPEREEFVETHDVENMSTRELQNAIAERDAAIKRAEKAEKMWKQRDKDFQEADKARDEAAWDRDEMEKENKKLQKQIKELEKRPAAVEPDQEAIDKAVAEAVEKANAAHTAELDKLKASEEKKRKALEKKVTDAENNAKAAEEKAAEAGKDAAGESDVLRAEADKLKAEADRLRRELAMSGEATVTFKLYFAAWQKDYANMMDALAKADEETAGRLRAAINAQIGGWTNG